MNNDLKNFLEGEKRRFEVNFLDEDYIEFYKDHDTKLVNFVLDLVEKEVEKKKYGKGSDEHIYLDELSTIVNNLRV